MEILIWALEIVFFLLGTYIAGLIAMVPGLVLGRHLEMSGPKWPAHLGILVLGLVVSALVFNH